MVPFRQELVNDAIKNAFTLIDPDINNNNNTEEKHNFLRQTILANKSLTNEEKSEATRILNIRHDRDRILFINNERKEICENCKLERLCAMYCENCIRIHLEANFSNWTSGNNDVDNLIQICQRKSIAPHMVVEWIPHNNLKNIKYLKKGGCSDVYTADWIDGRYIEWDFQQQELIRFGTHEVILKSLVNLINRSWFEEAESHLTIGSRWVDIVTCYGITLDPLNNDYMLVLHKMDNDLRTYLRQNHNRLTWKERIQIIIYIVGALYRINIENAIYRDLHSGNILYYKEFDTWYICDLGFCGPANRTLNGVYGNLPYIAPEVLSEKGYTSASDIYSIAMIMWEVSSGQPPFCNSNHDYQLALDVVNGKRPKSVPGVPIKYKELMEQCWDAIPEKRPDIGTVLDRMKEIRKTYYQNMPEDKFDKNINPITDFFNNLSINSLKINEIDGTSKIYQFKNLPEPRNATEEEQEIFHSRIYSYNIPDNINDFSNQSSGMSKKLSKVFKWLRESSRNIIQLNYKKDIRRHIDDEIDSYNNPNLHSEEQDKLEISDDFLLDGF
ncbi:unnamed protein product [Rhizophagus irregularis]|nr:unnamed protein product [Rhizophagus irregularis]